MYFFVTFGITDNFLLAAMAIDQYAAICHPLHYTTTMSPRHCCLLVMASWAVSHLHSLTHGLPFFLWRQCHPPLLLWCSTIADTLLLWYLHQWAFGLHRWLYCDHEPFYLYCHLLYLYHLDSSEGPSVGGRYKALSTCGSPLTVVVLFYGTIISVYISPSSTYSVTKDRVVTVIHTVVTPMLNPFIYSLRSKDMKQAFKKLTCR